MPKSFIAVDPATEPSKTSMAILDANGALSTVHSFDTEVADIWKWRPDAEEHAKKVLANLGISESFLTSDFSFSASVSQRSYKSQLKPAVRQLHLDLKWWRDVWEAYKRRKFRTVRTAKARSRKARRTDQHWKRMPFQFVGTTTGRITTIPHHENIPK